MKKLIELSNYNAWDLATILIACAIFVFSFAGVLQLFIYDKPA